MQNKSPLPLPPPATAAPSAHAAPAGTPWLEFFPQGGGPAQKTPLLSFPFSTGRNDTTDLPINSTRVSREHAVIVRAGDTYRVRDLDSTNGTFVNGQRIEEATLSDGDILMIADVEFTFFSGNAHAVRKTITQVIGFREADGGGVGGQDVIRSVRRLQEKVLQASTCVVFRTIVDLASGGPFAFEAARRSVTAAGPQLEADRMVLSAHCRLTSRLRDSFWRLAAQRMADADPATRLFLPLHASDLDDKNLHHLLEGLKDTLPGQQRLVLDLPDSAVNDMPYFHEFHRRVRQLGVGLCYSDFAAGKAQLEVHKKAPPDFLKLARSMMRTLGQDATRQQQLENVVASARAIGCETIALEVDGQREIDICRQLGFRLACRSQAELSLPAPAARRTTVVPFDARLGGIPALH